MPSAPIKKSKKTGKGRASQYISRARALKKLQISLKDFRRLCILKGIYPREPPRRPKDFVGHRAYYHVKDILWLRYEPLLQKYWDLKTWFKKKTKFKNKGRMDRIQTLEQNRPKLTYSHLVRERFPDFDDALRQLNDPLSMVNLFALVPAKRRSASSKPGQIRSFRRLAKEFELYVLRSRSLRKAFVSIKGIYYEAVIKGTPVMWLVPHKFAQYVPKDVDYAVMGTFLKFYETMLRFVNYKLYLTAGDKYPPKLEMGARTLELKEDKAPETKPEPKKIENLEGILAKASPATGAEAKNEGGEDENEGQPATGEPDQKSWPDRACTLFEGLFFLLNRETPQEALEFVITSCGGRVVWQQATRDTGIPEGITHQVIDRKAPKGEAPQWELVQPQWVFDSLNVGTCVPARPYRPGTQCPPHLSPYQSEDAAYEPKQAEVLREWAKIGKSELAELEQEGALPNAQAEGKEGNSGEQEVEAILDSDDDMAEDGEEEEEGKPPAKKKRGAKRAREDEPGTAAGNDKKRAKKQDQTKRVRRRDLSGIKDLEARKKMLPRKYRGVFKAIEKSNEAWKAEGDALRRKAEKIKKQKK